MTISEADLNAVFSHVSSQFPHEVCGFLAGVGRWVKRVYPITNVAPNSAVQFRMDPAEQVRALIDIDRNGWDVIAIYHSHPPGAKLTPSAVDIAEYTYPGAHMLIALVGKEPGSVSVAAFCIKHERAIQVDLVISS